MTNRKKYKVETLLNVYTSALVIILSCTCFIPGFAKAWHAGVFREIAPVRRLGHKTSIDGVINTKTKNRINRPVRSEKYTLPLTINANGYAREDKPVEILLNFTALLKDRQLSAVVKPASLAMVEVDSLDNVIDRNVLFQFDRAPEYDSLKSAMGTLTFIMKGHTSPDQDRHYQLSFGERPVRRDPNHTLVKFENVGIYEGFEALRIISSAATYYYHTGSGGFASLIDKEGHDWISYHPNEEPESGMKGRYRGIPNIAPPEFHPGSPDPQKTTAVIARGPIKVSLVTETTDHKWRERWDIYPAYATMSLLKKGQEPYWILYEGTPGGEFNLDDYWIRSDGTREEMKPYTLQDQWSDHLPSPKWVCFGDKNLNRVMYYVHHEDYPYEDVFWHSGEGGMTVFGFGRGPTREQNWQQLTTVPAHLTVGFSEQNDFSDVSRNINNTYKSLKINTGTLSKSK